MMEFREIERSEDLIELVVNLRERGFRERKIEDAAPRRYACKGEPPVDCGTFGTCPSLLLENRDGAKVYIGKMENYWVCYGATFVEQ